MTPEFAAAIAHNFNTGAARTSALTQTPTNHDAEHDFEFDFNHLDIELQVYIRHVRRQTNEIFSFQTPVILF